MRSKYCEVKKLRKGYYWGHVYALWWFSYCFRRITTLFFVFLSFDWYNVRQYRINTVTNQIKTEKTLAPSLSQRGGLNN
ncbi:hypothetical protein HanRHA438_Chr06g0267931 [Helianthus annuus]|nr:hypothetical protein HanRHA438_Chr06g0267931 [Helianthus annuus]